MCVKFRVGSKRSTAVRTRDHFLFGVTPYVFPQLVQTGVLAVASGPLALNSALDLVATRKVLCMHSDMI